MALSRLLAGAAQKVNEVGTPTVNLTSGTEVGLEAGTIVELPTSQYVDFFATAALGLLSGVDTILVLGTNATLPTSTETLWSQSNVYSFPTTATVATIVSDNVNDTIAGTGGRVLSITGVDFNRNRVTEIVLMDGTNTVDTLQQFFRINNMSIVGAGSTLTNEGNITATVDGTIISEITTNRGFATQGVFSPEVDENILITNFILDVGRNDSGTLSVVTRFSIDGGVNTLKNEIGPVISIFQSTQVTPYPFLLAAPSGVFIDLEIITENTGSGTISVTGGFNGFTFTDAFLAS